MEKPHLNFEKKIWKEGGLACGIDEVGRGCIAGPVVSAAVIMPLGHKGIENVRDSKKLTPKMRKEIYHLILDQAEDFGVGLVPADEIDKLGINGAIQRAMSDAIGMLSKKPEMVLTDAVIIENLSYSQKAIIRGDEHIYSISAASIVAKVFRDAVVSGFDNIYPEYFFSSHKGYGTKKHYEAVKKHGTTREHRKTFMKNL